MTEEQLIGLLEQLGEELGKKFVKAYSKGRLEQVVAHITTLKSLVSGLHSEADNEEDQARKDSVIQRMVRNEERPLSEATEAVERGER